MTTTTHEELMTDVYAAGIEDVKHIHLGYWTPDMDVSEVDLAQTRYLEELTKLISIKEGDTILDLGCGTGESSIWLAKKFGCFVHAIDIVKENVNKARQAVKNAKLEQLVHLHHMDAMEMDFEVGSFDHVIAVESIHHVKNKEELFKKIQKVLKPGGYFTLSEYLLERPCSWMSYKMASDQTQSKHLRGFGDYYEMFSNTKLQLIDSVDVTDNTIIKFLGWNKSINYEFYKKYMRIKYGHLLTYWLSFILPINDYFIIRLARNKIFKVGFMWCRNSN